MIVHYTDFISKKILEFYLDQLIINKRFLIFFRNNTEDYNDILLKFLLNKGEGISEFYFDEIRQSALCQLILNHIETSTNCSNIINYVLFNGCQWTHFNLSERAKNIERKTYGPNDCIKYQIVNIYDPKIKFLIICWQSITGTIVQFEIKRISG
ncbi:hypothetical protein ACQ4LE_004809 [Meloidogyne hapla]